MGIEDHSWVAYAETHGDETAGRNKRPWRDATHLEVAAAECADGYNRRRLHAELGTSRQGDYEQLHANHTTS